MRIEPSQIIHSGASTHKSWQEPKMLGISIRHQRNAVRLLSLVVLVMSGCQTFGPFSPEQPIPANRLPTAYRAVPKSNMIPISMDRLRQEPPKVYQLGAGDVLGIYIETVVGGDEGETPPVHFPEDASQAPSVGFPIPVGEDGTISLPFIPPLQVEGLTLPQTTEAIRKAYTIDKHILQPGKDRIIVTLLRPRSYQVLVVREESGGQEGVSKRGSGSTVDLPAYKNDVLHALNETGGMPGLDARNELIIYRGGFTNAAERDELIAQIYAGTGPCDGTPVIPDAENMVRIPLRYYPTQYPRFTEDDIILKTGDIVMIRARDREKFYTGGMLGGGEYLLPRDYDLDILGAIALAHGPLGSGGTGIAQVGSYNSGGNFSGGGGRGGGLVAPSRAIIVRKVSDGGQIPIEVDLDRALADPSQRILIQPEDMIVVQYTMLEEIYSVLLNMLQFNVLLNGFSGSTL